MMTIFAQDAGHQTMARTRIAAASMKRQKQNFMEITPIKKFFSITIEEARVGQEKIYLFTWFFSLRPEIEGPAGHEYIDAGRRAVGRIFNDVRLILRDICCITFGEFLLSVIIGKNRKFAPEHHENLRVWMSVEWGSMPRGFNEVLNGYVTLTA